MSVRKVLLVAGEASGDLHGATLVHAIHEIDPSIAVSGDPLLTLMMPA